MFSKFKRLVFGESQVKPNDSNAYRRAVYESELDEPELTVPAATTDDVEILAFGRDFAPEGAEDEGYVLLTNGMSDRRMTVTAAHLERGVWPRAELMWYVREPTSEIISTMQWLAEYPFIDQTRLGFGHRIHMPQPPLAGSDFRTYLFLTPIIGPDKRIAENLSVDGDKVAILTVNLISDAELAFIKAEGLDAFFDLLDERNYPSILDLNRRSYV